MVIKFKPFSFMNAQKFAQISNCQEKTEQYEVDFETFPHNFGTQIRNDQNA